MLWLLCLRLARLGSISFSNRKTVLGKPDAKSLETDSKNTIPSSLRFIKQVSGKTKDQRLDKYKSKNPHQRSPYAMKFEDRSHEETERQQRCARSKAWNLAKNMDTVKEKTKLHFTRPRKNGHSQLRQQKKPEEREFVVYSGAGMHMVSKRDLNSAELETMRSSTTVMKTNGEVQTREEATVYVKELDFFVTVVLLDETPAVLSLGKLCEYHGYALPLDQRSKTASHQKWPENWLQIVKLCAIRSPSFIYEFSLQRPLLLLHHLYHRIPNLTKADTPKIQYQKEVEVRVRTYGDTCSINRQKSKNWTKRRSTKLSVIWIAALAAGVQREFGRWT